MELTFIQLPRFASKWDKFKLNDEDLQALEGLLRKNPNAGDVMRGTGGLRKIRFAPPSHHTGKSGAFRVGYAFFRIGSVVYFFTIFAKEDKANLTAADCKEFKKIIEVLSEFHKR